MPKQDTFTRNIRTQMKSIFTAVPNYAKGTAKLFLATGTEFFNAQMPAPASFLETNQELLTDSIRFLRNPIDAVNKKINRAMDTDDFKALSKIAKYALDDLKTGKLYEAERDRTNYGQSVDNLLDDFGGFDMGNFDENGDWSEPDTRNDDIIDSSIKIAQVQENNAGKRTEATIGAIGSATEAIVTTQNANAQTNLRVSMKQHSQTMNMMQNAIVSQNATFELVNQGIQAQLQVTREAHNQIISEIGDIKKLLGEIRDGVSPKQTKETYKDQSTIFSDDGRSIDLKKYIKQVTKNVDTKFNVSSLIGTATMGMSISDLVDMYASNPWMIAAQLAIGKVVPEQTKQKMQRTNKSLENFLPALIQKMGDRGKKFDSGEGDWKDAVAGLFGITPRSKKAINTDMGPNYTKQAVITNKFIKSVEEVIPMWLSRIDSHISGQPMMVYNYKTGRLEKATSVMAKYEHDVKDLTRGMSDSSFELMNRAEAYKFKTSKQKGEFQDFVYQYLQTIGENGSFVNPFVSMEEFKKAGVTAGNQTDLFYNLLNGILTSMPREGLMQISKDLMNARVERDKKTFEINNELRDTGLIAAFADFIDPDLSKDIKNKTVQSKSGLSEQGLTDIYREYRKKSKKPYGVGATNEYLGDILATLRKGIITYSFNAGTISDISDQSTLALLKDVMKNATDQRADDERRRTQEVSDKARREERHQDELKRANRDRGILLNEMYVEDSTTAEIASLMQSSYNAADGAKDPVTERYQNLFNNTATKLKNKVDGTVNKSGIAKILGTLQKSTKKPFELFNAAMDVTDAFLFKILYGEDAVNELSGSSSDEPYLLKVLSHSLSVHFKNAKDWFKEHIGEPIKNYLFNKESGLFPKIAEKIKEIAQPGIDKIKEKGQSIKEKYVGTKDETGKYTGGRFSDKVNKFVVAKDDAKTSATSYIGNALNRMLYGDYASTKGVGGSNYYVDNSGNYVPYGEKKYGGVIGKLREGFNRLQNFLFGEDDPETGRPTDSRRKWNKVKGEFDKAFPDMIIGGAAGAGIGLVTSLWLPGGPLLGAMIGSGLGLIKGSDQLKEFLFGKEVIGKDGKPTREGKLISQNVYEGFKKFAPKVGIGVIAGGLAGGLGLLPLGIGPLLGSVFGSIGGMTAASDKMKELIFGDNVDPDTGLFSKNFREKAGQQIKRYAPSILGGAMIGSTAWNMISGVGLIPGLSLLPGGPILGFLGASVGVANADKINKFFFGDEVTEEVEEEVPDGKGGTKKVKKTKKNREGGVFSKVYDTVRDKMITPLAKRFDSAGKKIENWFKESIITPFSNSIEPLKQQMIKAGQRVRDSMANIGNAVVDGIAKAFNISINGDDGKGGFKAFFQDKVLKRLDNMTSRIFNAIGKVIGGIISAPFKALEFIVAGTISGKDKDERREEHERKKEEKRKRKNAKRHSRWAKRRRRSMNRIRRLMGLPEISEPTDDSDDDTDLDNVIPMGGDLAGGGSVYYGTDGKIHYNVADVADDVLNAAENAPIPSSPGESEISDEELEKLKKSSSIEDKMRAQREEERRRNVKSGRRKESSSDVDSKSSDDRHASGEDEKNTRKRNKIKRKTDNEYLADIAKYSKRTYDEIKGQIGGVGWNTAYIKAILEKQYGVLSPEDLPEEMEGSARRNIRKRRSFVGRMFDRFGIGERLSGFKDSMSARFGKVAKFAGRVKSAVKNPIGLFMDALGFVGEKLFTFGSGIVNIGKNIWKLFKSLFSFIGKGFKIAWGVIKKTGSFLWKTVKEFGKTLWGGLKTLAGVVGDAVSIVTATARGLTETVMEFLPDVAHFLWGGIKGVGKGLFKGFKFLGKHTAGAIKGGAGWLKNKLFGKKKGANGTKPGDTDPTKKTQQFTINGGYLDSIQDAVTIDIGDHNKRVPFPYTRLRRNGKAFIRPRYAIPVYIAGLAPYVTVKTASAAENVSAKGESESNSNVEVKDDFMTMYRRTDAAASKANMPAAVYDKMMKSAKTKDEVQAIALTQQLNQGNAALALPGETKEKGSFLETLMSLLGNIPGLLPKLAKFLPGAAAVLTKLLKGGKSGVGRLGSTVKSLGKMFALPVAGNIVADQTGMEDMKTGNYMKMGVAGAKGLTSYLGRTGVEIKSPWIADRTGEVTGKKQTIISKIINGVIKAAKGAIRALGKLIGAERANKIITFLSEFQTKLGTKLAALGSGALKQLLKKANIVVTAAVAIADLWSGWDSAAYILSIESTDVTTGMRAAAAAAKCLSGLAFGLIPVQWLAENIYKLFAGSDGDEKLDESQARLEAKAAAAGKTVEEYNEEVNKDDRNIFQKAWDYIKNGPDRDDPNYQPTPMEKWGPKGPGWGKGSIKIFSQRDAKWNRDKSKAMSKVGCGPTVAAMVGSAYGDHRTPADANKLSYAMNMRAQDGGTNPAFFNAYSGTFGKGGYQMKEGPTNPNLISSNLAKKQPVVLMGRGGVFGGNDHYLVADGISGKGNVRVADPLTGSKKSVGIGNVLSNTKRSIYSWGKGPNDFNPMFINKDGETPQLNTPMDNLRMGTSVNNVVNNTTTGQKAIKKEEDRRETNLEAKADEIRAAQQALVDKMYWLKDHPIKYSTKGNQNPDNGSSSCAATVGWAYDKVLGVSGMSASTQEQVKDDRFTTVLKLGETGTVPGKTFDVNNLQPGDIIYMKNPSSNHTEMYVGNGIDLNHGGPGRGPVERKLNEARQKKVFAVRRYTPFVTGDDINYNADGSVASSSSSGDDETPLDNIFTRLSTMFDKLGNSLGASKDAIQKILSGEDGSSDDSSSGSTTATTESSIPGSNIKEKMWNHLHDKGLTDEQAAGVIGNLKKESDLRPNNVENYYEKKYGDDNGYTTKVDNIGRWPENTYGSPEAWNKGYKSGDKVGYGLAQWTFPSRKTGLLDLAKSRNASIADVGVQTDFLWHELSNNYSGTLANLKAAKTVAEASRIFLAGYEMNEDYLKTSKGQSDLQERTEFGHQVFDELKGTDSENTKPKPKTATQSAIELHGGKGLGWGKGPEVSSFSLGQDGLFTDSGWGTGAGTNLFNANLLTEAVRNITKIITNTKNKAEQEATVDTTTEKIESAVKTATSSGATNEILTVLTNSLATMIQLLTEIKANTASTVEKIETNTAQQSSKYKTARADNFTSNSATGASGVDTGKEIVDTLTRI